MRSWIFHPSYVKCARSQKNAHSDDSICISGNVLCGGTSAVMGRLFNSTCTAIRLVWRARCWFSASCRQALRTGFHDVAWCGICLKPLHELIEGDRAPGEVALYLVASGHLHDVELAFILNAFDDDLAAKAMCHIHNRQQDAACTVAFGDLRRQ